MVIEAQIHTFARATLVLSACDLAAVSRAKQLNWNDEVVLGIARVSRALVGVPPTRPTAQ
jgi:hypothetical protein